MSGISLPMIKSQLHCLNGKWSIRIRETLLKHSIKMAKPPLLKEGRVLVTGELITINIARNGPRLPRWLVTMSISTPIEISCGFGAQMVLTGTVPIDNLVASLNHWRLSDFDSNVVFRRSAEAINALPPDGRNWQNVTEKQAQVLAYSR